MVPLAALLIRSRTPRHRQRPRLLSSDVDPPRVAPNPGIQGVFARTRARRTATPSSSETPPRATTSRPRRRSAGGLPVLSLPQAIRQYLLPGKTSVVITGTHGKTTTSALTAWLLFDCGRDPGFLVGGEMRNLGRGYRRGAGPHFVLEGDEYNAAFFDRGPKFLHYEPRHLFIGNIEYDHADLFPDLDAVVDAFRRSPRSSSRRTASSSSTATIRARSASTENAVARRVLVSTEDLGADFAAADVAYRPEGTEFTLVEGGTPTARLTSPLLGHHNVRERARRDRARRAASASRRPRSRARSPRFAGVRRRLEVKGEKNGIVVVDDFAHHPTAVDGDARGGARPLAGAPDLGALRAALEHRGPQDLRGGLRRGVRRRRRPRHRAGLPRRAACRPRPESTARRSSRDSRAAGKPAFAPEKIEEIPGYLAREVGAGDVLLLMSSGAFGGLPETLLEILASNLIPPPRDS